MASKIINIIIAGTGGQGVSSLYRILLNLCDRNAIYSKGALFKGGAQRHGTVHATLRLFFDSDPEKQWYSSQIREKYLDLLIGLEPWETLRYSKFTSDKTLIRSNTMVVPLFSKRFLATSAANPVELLMRLPGNVRVENYSEMAYNKFNDQRMANYLIGIETIKSGILPFGKNGFIDEFIDIIKPARKIEDLIRKDILRNGEMEKK